MLSITLRSVPVIPVCWGWSVTGRAPAWSAAFPSSIEEGNREFISLTSAPRATFHGSQEAKKKKVGNKTYMATTDSSTTKSSLSSGCAILVSRGLFSAKLYRHHGTLDLEREWFLEMVLSNTIILQWSPRERRYLSLGHTEAFFRAEKRRHFVWDMDSCRGTQICRLGAHSQFLSLVLFLPLNSSFVQPGAGSLGPGDPLQLYLPLPPGAQDPRMLSNITVCPVLEYMRNDTGPGNSSNRYIDYASVTLHGLVSLLGMAENAIILFVVGCHMRQTVVTTWVLHLALSDLLATASLPFFTYFLAVGHSWQLGTTFCRLHSSIFFLNMFASGFLLSAISLDRCLQVVKPIWAQNQRTVAGAQKVCLVLWGLAVLNTIPYFLFRDTIKRQDERVMCYYNVLLYNPGPDPHAACGRRQMALAVSKFLVAFAIPLVIIAACYLAVSLQVRYRCRRRPSRFVRLVMAVIAAFVLCWLPYHVFSLLEVQAHYDPSLRRLVKLALPFVTSLAFINSVINPFLYVLTCPDVLRKLRRSLRCVLESVLVEDSELGGGGSGRRRRSSQGASLFRSPSTSSSTAGYRSRWAACLLTKITRQPRRTSASTEPQEGK
uniref:Prostaglandin D2 receptor 2 n=1 Tax=Monodelphis domestica TaxID=13616 RepID=F7FWX0_MONDO